MKSRRPIGAGCSKRSACRLIAAFMLSAVVHAGAGGSDGWTRGIADIGTRPADPSAFRPFELVTVSGEGDHVYGLCVFTNVTPALVAIDGTETPDGEFYPNVALQVANDEEGEWRALDPSSHPGKKAALTIEAKQVSKSLMVDLDAFRPMIGKFKYGKIALRTGEAAVVFKLEKLLPPQD